MSAPELTFLDALNIWLSVASAVYLVLSPYRFARSVGWGALAVIAAALLGLT